MHAYITNSNQEQKISGPHWTLSNHGFFLSYLSNTFASFASFSKVCFHAGYGLFLLYFCSFHFYFFWFSIHFYLMCTLWNVKHSQRLTNYLYLLLTLRPLFILLQQSVSLSAPSSFMCFWVCLWFSFPVNSS